MNSEKMNFGREPAKPIETYDDRINRKFVEAVVGAFGKSAEKVKNDHRYDGVSLAEIKEKDPVWLQNWALAHLSSNGESTIGKENKNYRSWHFDDLGELSGYYGTKIGYGPQLKAEDFPEALREKNPGITTTGFRHKIEDSKRTGEEIIILVDRDFDELQLPDGYGLRKSDSSTKQYSSCNTESYQAGGDVICHRENFLRAQFAKDSGFGSYGNFNQVYGGPGDYRLYPEEYRIVVKKPPVNNLY